MQRQKKLEREQALAKRERDELLAQVPGIRGGDREPARDPKKTESREKLLTEVEVFHDFPSLASKMFSPDQKFASSSRPAKSVYVSFVCQVRIFYSFRTSSLS